MNKYSLHFIDRNDFVFALDQIESTTDSGAIVTARARPQPTFAAGFEVWREERLIYRAVLCPRRTRRDSPPAAHQHEMAAYA
jgi:hypothetical protein